MKKGIFPDIWKKGNIIPVHKKEGKTLINNYLSISLLPIFEKMFEDIIEKRIIDYIILFSIIF